MPQSYVVPSDPMKIYLAICSPLYIELLYYCVKKKNPKAKEELEKEYGIKFEQDGAYFPSVLLSQHFKAIFPRANKLDYTRINLKDLEWCLSLTPEIDVKMFKEEIEEKYQERLQVRIWDLNENFDLKAPPPSSRSEFIKIARELTDKILVIIDTKDTKAIAEDLKKRGLEINERILKDIGTQSDFKEGREPLKDYQKRLLGLFIKRSESVLLDDMLRVAFKEMPPVLVTGDEFDNFLKRYIEKNHYNDLIDGIEKVWSTLSDIGDIADKRFLQYIPRSAKYISQMRLSLDRLLSYLEEFKVEEKKIEELRKYSEEIIKIFGIRSSREAKKQKKQITEKFGNVGLKELGQMLVAKIVDPLLDKITVETESPEARCDLEMEKKINDQKPYAQAFGRFELDSFLGHQEEAILRFMYHYFERDIQNIGKFLAGKRLQSFEILQNLNTFYLIGESLSLRNSKIPVGVREKALKHLAGFVEKSPSDFNKANLDIMTVTEILERAEGYAMPAELVVEFDEALLKGDLSLFFDTIKNKPRFVRYYSFLRNNHYLE
jgi:hypothetical protein